MDTEYQDPEEFLPGLPRTVAKPESQSSSRNPVYENTPRTDLTSNTHPSPIPPPRTQHNQPKPECGLQAVGQATARPSASEGPPSSDHHLNISSSPSANGPTGKQAGARRPKPIMGQSVLQASQRQVMPVVTNLSNMRSSESAPTGFSSGGAGAGAAAGAGGGRQAQKVQEKESNVPPPLPKKQKHPVVRVFLL